jgi:hypothetical protein
VWSGENGKAVIAAFRARLVDRFAGWVEPPFSSNMRKIAIILGGFASNHFAALLAWPWVRLLGIGETRYAFHSEVVYSRD